MNDMIYADVPKDLTKIKTKLAFGLTKRQIICFGSGISDSFQYLTGIRSS